MNLYAIVDFEKVPAESECVYLCGNSLGLMPKKSRKYVEREMERWATLGVHGHSVGHMSWINCDEAIQDKMAAIVGARTEEVVLMNALTVNQHLLLISFYQPTPTRYKVLIEAHAFPSDHFAVESEIRLKGYDPESSMLLLSPREGEQTWRTEDIVEVIQREGDSIALVMLSGVHYYTGQLFDMEAITKAAHQKGCYVGFDLAHAAGNVPLHCHDWGMDFACWCTYKYLSAGAGGIGGAFIHERHAQNDFPKLHGWWSHDPRTRFKMDNKLVATPSPSCYRISNPSMFHCASLEGSLEVMLSAGMPALRTKSLLLTGYLELLILHHFPQDGATDKKPSVEVITPSDPQQRGSQLTLNFSMDIEAVFKDLKKRGVVCDLRLPNALRVAPVAMWSSFRDVYKFIRFLTDIIAEHGTKAHAP